MQCNKCGSQWNTSLSSISQCPFCGGNIAPDNCKGFTNALDGFTYTIDNYGKDLLKDSNKLYAYLYDIIPNFPTERRVIKTASEMGIYDILLEADYKGNTEKSLAIKMAVLTLINGAGLTEYWAVTAAEFFASLFGWEISLITRENRGSLPGNIINYGLVAEYESDLFFRNENDNEKLYKYQPSGLLKLTDDNGCFINVLDGFVYYSNWSDNEKLYKIQTDGNGRTKLNDDETSFINVVDGQIYYVNGSDGDKLYRISINGNERQKLLDEECLFINVTGGFVYYINGLDGWICKIRIDGTQHSVIEKVSACNLTVLDGWIYYCNKGCNNSLYRMRYDGSGKTVLSEDNCFFINVTKEQIFYCNFEQERKLYKMNIDGTNAAPLTNDKTGRINYGGGWVYYTNYTEGKKLYKIRPDGTKRQPV